MFSVVIPAYNCESTITDVLDSVKKQTRYDLIEEVIIVNDGSTDKTDEVIRNYMDNNIDMDINYVVQNNHGVSYTRNRCIRMAKAEWIALLDADDLWIENKLERQYECIKENPQISFLGAVGTLKFFVKQYKGLCKVTPKQLCIRNCPQTSSVVFKKKDGMDIGLYDEKRRYGEDIQFYQKFFLKDSYYMLAEKLTEVDYDKEYFSQTGLTSNLKKMHLGRNENTRELYDMELISKPYMYLMLIMNQFKYYRRLMIRFCDKYRN